MFGSNKRQLQGANCPSSSSEVRLIWRRCRYIMLPDGHSMGPSMGTDAETPKRPMIAAPIGGEKLGRHDGGGARSGVNNNVPVMVQKRGRGRLSEFKGTAQQSEVGATRATARLPVLNIEVVHRRSPDGDSEQISINLHAVPSF